MLHRAIFSKSISIIGVRASIVLASLMVFSFFSHSLDANSYGSYITLYVALSIGISIGSIGLGTIVFNYNTISFSYFIKYLSLKKKILYSLFLLLISYTFAFYLGWQQIFTFEWKTMLPAACLVLLSVLSFVLDNILLLYKKYKQQILINLLYSIAFVVIHIHVGKLPSFSINHLIIYWSFILLIKLLFQYFLFIQQYQKTLPLLKSDDIRLPHVKTWWQLGFYDVFQLVVKQADKFLVTLIAQKEIAAGYYNGRLEIPLLPQILNSVRNSALITLSSGKHTKDEAIFIIRNTFEILSTIGIVVVVFGITYRVEIITLIFSEKYTNIIPVFVLTLLILPAQYCISLSYILQYKEKADLINKGAFLDLIVSLILIFPFFTWWSYQGIVAAILASTYIQSIYYLYHSSKAINTSIMLLIPWESYLFKTFFFSLITLLSYYFISSFSASPISRLMIGGCLVISCTFWLFYRKSNRKKYFF